MSIEKTGWGVFTDGARLHVAPLNDLREHEIKAPCWCRPQEDEGVMVHSAMDQRQAYEQGRRPS